MLLRLAAVVLSCACAAPRPEPIGRPAPSGESFTLPVRGICAHRGASTTHPENTLAALRAAAELGAHMIEIDLRRSRDGAVVMMHDETVDRTTNGHGAVAELTLEQLKALDAGSWKSPQFRGERVPTLAEALAILPHDVWLNLHLKGGEELAAQVTLELQKNGRLRQAFLACSQAAAAAARRIEPRVSICNMDRQNDTDRYVAETIAMRAAFIQLTGEQRRLILTTEQLRQAGVRINYCCTNDVAEARRLLENGVDFVLVDEVAEMLAAVRALGIEPLAPAVR